MGDFIDVYDSLMLHVSNDKFYIEATNGTREVVIIDRLNYDIEIQVNQGQIPPDVTSKSICGIMGIVHLLADGSVYPHGSDHSDELVTEFLCSTYKWYMPCEYTDSANLTIYVVLGPYLVVITQKVKMGDLNGQPIWRVEDTEVISYSKTLLHLSESQSQDNRVYISMLQSMSLLERADQRFVWNGHMLRELAQQPELSRYCLPVIHGFVSIRSCFINQKMFSWCLISRRSCFRAGTRFFMRGIDMEGHAANYIETEQIVEYNGDCSAFTQTRGSIPLFWSQRPNLRYKPTPLLNPTQNHVDGFSRHFDSQIYGCNYGKQVIINLIDHKGAEYHLEKALAEMVHIANNPNIRYESFDFHHECRKMRWDRLSILLERVAQDQEEFGYFLRLRDGTVPLQQEGIFRTNCMDCLDRTNVVQSLLARRSMQRQLVRLGILHEGQKIEDQTSFEAVFKNVWADNADVCSIQYAGTGALKTDYTRTGKRSIIGLLKDGWNSLIRYYKNNFSDGFRQDSIDLLLGNYQVERDEGVTKPSPLQQDRDWKYLALPVILLVALSMCFLTILIPSEYSLETLLYFLFWVAMSAIAALVIMYYGTEFVDRPRLCENSRKKMD